MEHRASTRILHLTVFLASVLFSIQVFLTLLASSSTILCRVFLGLPLLRLPWGSTLGLAWLIVGRFSLCMAQPSALAFPDLQIYSRLLRMLPQLFIRYLVWPENTQYFPEAFINKDLQLGCYTF